MMMTMIRTAPVSRRRVVSTVPVILAAITACGVRVVDPAARPAPPASEDAVPRVEASVAHGRLKDGTAILIDTRGSEAYSEAHVSGALSMPVGVVEGDVAGARRKLAPGKLAIFYCT